MRFLSTTFMLSLCLALCNCQRYPQKQFSFGRVNYKGTELKIDGIYHSNHNCSYCFYRNGIVYGGWYSKNLQGALKIWELYASDPKWIGILSKYPENHGIFTVSSTDITIERWLVKDMLIKYHPIQYKGTILNDSTFILRGGSYGVDTFHFHPVRAKPDSLSRFIR